MVFYKRHEDTAGAHDWDIQYPELLIIPEANWKLYFHIFCMIMTFSVLFPTGIILAMKKNRLHTPVQTIGYVIFMIGYFAGHNVDGHYGTSKAHKFLEPFLFLLVNSQVFLGMASKLAITSFPRWRIITKPVHFCLGLAIIFGSFVQSMTGLTTAFAICQPSEFGNCFSHFGLGSALVWLACLGLGQSQGVFMLPLSLDEIISTVTFIFGFINLVSTHRWGTNWSHKDYQHTTSGLLWTIGGILCLLMIHKFKSSPNPFPSLIFFIQGFQMILHVQHSQYAVLMHNLFGWALVVSSICQWFSIYTKNEHALILTHSLWVLAGVTFMASNSDAMTKMNASDIDVNSYATMVCTAGMFVILYVFIVAYFLRTNNGTKVYDRLESTSTIENDQDAESSTDSLKCMEDNL